MTIYGKNDDYGNYRLNTFPSAFGGSVHVAIDRVECEYEPDAAARLDVSPDDARRFAARLIDAADLAESNSRAQTAANRR